MNVLFIWLLKLLAIVSRSVGLGAGSTWPGHIMLGVRPSFLKEFGQNFNGKIIAIAGTNGKTTTSKLLRTILEANDNRVIHNESGANLLNGIASSIVLHSDILGALNYNYAIFEIDENSLPILLDELTPDMLVILNLFRDQLDRYGEVNTVALKWKRALQTLPKTTTVVLNANDPEIAFLGKGLEDYSSNEAKAESRSLKSSSSRQARTIKNVLYFGLSNTKLYLAKRPHAMDSVYCPSCGSYLLFDGIYLGHLGNWKCSSCLFQEPMIDLNGEKSTLPGIYNIYNTQAATLVAETLGIFQKTINVALTNFTPAFGRQEEFVIDEKKVKIFLSKNPTGFNESIRTIKELGAIHVLLVLNDRIPDGRDVSWIWDVDFEELDGMQDIIVSGDRAYDLGLRIKYTIQNSEFRIQNGNVKFRIIENLRDAIKESLVYVETNETLYILPTYSAMLEVRKILTGKKIL